MIDRREALLVFVEPESASAFWKDAMVSKQKDIFRLYLLRHAHAAWAAAGVGDFDRQLDAKGIAEARSVALQAYTAGLVPSAIVSSPARRCVETTAAFLEIFGDLPVSYDRRLYSEGVEVYLEKLSAHCAGESLMLVGHNPMMEALASSLSAESNIGATLAHGYPTAGLLALDFHRPVTKALSHRGAPALLLTPTLT